MSTEQNGDPELQRTSDFRGFQDNSCGVLRVHNETKTPELDRSFFIADFSLGETVYLVTDDDQKKRVIVGVLFAVDGGVQYHLACGTSNTWHFKAEIQREKSVCPEN